MDQDSFFLISFPILTFLCWGCQFLAEKWLVKHIFFSETVQLPSFTLPIIIRHVSCKHLLFKTDSNEVSVLSEISSKTVYTQILTLYLHCSFNSANLNGLHGAGKSSPGLSTQVRWRLKLRRVPALFKNIKSKESQNTWKLTCSLADISVIFFSCEAIRKVEISYAIIWKSTLTSCDPFLMDFPRSNNLHLNESC